MVSRFSYLGNLSLGYRYSFNGKENDADVKGDGNQIDYGMRVYEPRLGKFLSLDPLTKKYPELTPYQFASNKPINSIDIDGLEGWDLSTPLHNLKQRAVIQQDRAQMKAQEIYKQFSAATNTPLFLRQGEQSSRQNLERRDYINLQRDIDANIGPSSNSDPVSHGGGGFGAGMVRDPFFQTSTALVAPELYAGYGGYQTYEGIRERDPLKATTGILMMLPMVPKYLTVPKIPYGFNGSGHFQDIANNIRNVSGTIANDVEVGIRGSRVSGISFQSGNPVTAASDFDFFIVSDQLYGQGLKLGLKSSNGALPVGGTLKFSLLTNLEKQLSTQLGNKATIRIFSKEGFEKLIMQEGNYILAR